MISYRALWHRSCSLALAGALAVFGCVEDYHFVPDGPADAGPSDGGDGGEPPPPSTPTACTTDDDCADLANTTLCDDKAGYCVECDPTREAELRRCGSGTYCAAGGHCVLGCQEDADCPGISCDVDRGLCVNCVSDSNCAPGTACVDAVCTPSCAGDDSCPTGWLCCEGTCKNLATDTASCGACGTVCDEGGACWNGVCGEGPCAPGTAECDGDASNGCETATQDDPQNCGKCHLACASNFCAGGRCTTMECAPGTADCNGDENDHCETDLTSVTDCGMCDAKCSDVHGEPSCGKDGCSIACDEGFENCDDKAQNGCEIDLQTDERHCGDCDTTCENEHGTTKCEDGECQPRCADGYDDCDGDPSNGCETDTNSALYDCGACGKKCTPENATGSCVQGVCKAKCAPGFADCDGNKANGCEADLNSPETCGDCDTACSANGGRAKCNPDDHTCTIKCDPDRADCVNGVADGCETDITASASNCGGCGHACTSSVGTAACIDSQCGVSDCTAPLETCPGAGKCETNLSNDAKNCGDCGHTCAFPSASGKCVNRVCELDQCDSGHKDCNGVAADGCEVALGTKQNCRSCGEACTNDHGDNECTANGCSPVCAAGWGDCDGNKNNGCETPLNSLSNCGGCGKSCSKGHATPTCSSGSCQILACATGWDDCSSNEDTAKDGCETQLNTNSNCGGCGVPCMLANATASCASGTCQLQGCSANYGDCTSQAGCETPLHNTANCNACGDKCGATNASPQCVAAGSAYSCQLNCATHYGDCDGDKTTGCETQLNSKTNCGACGTRCDDLSNATGSCSTYACVQACKGGFLDCTNADGCETPKGTSDNCTKCGETCSNAHGTSSCGATGCTATCTDPAWGNCDGKLENGCETSLRTNTNCNTCNTACDIPNSGESCSTGTCTATTCQAGFDDCNQDGTCETSLKDPANCNACGHKCTALNGTNDCVGSAPPYACQPSCTTGFGDCNQNPDDGCETPFKTNSDCTGCGDTCARAHATASCSTGTCTLGTCNAGFRNCNTESSAKDGCETSITSSPNCGACGVVCTPQNGTNPCGGSGDAYSCKPSCNSGFADCTNPNDGCETPLRTLTDCASCGDVCARAHASASCSTGTCVTGGCVGNYLNCNAEDTAKDGCEVAIDDANCGSCGKACQQVNSVNRCTVNGASSVCVPTCAGGFGDCDGKPETGCETDLKTPANCGVCGKVCTFANAAAQCVSGACALGTCSAGYANCNNVASDGCEVQLGVQGNCSKCGETCSSSHGTNTCDPTLKQCVITKCDANYDSCDGDPANGCETDLRTPSHCGSCDRVCDPNGPTPDCVGVTSGSTTTYSCQARVTYVNDTESSSNTATLDFSHSLSAGTNRIVLAAIVSETTNNKGLAGARPETVTYGNVAMTAVTNGAWSLDPGYDVPQLYYYYLTDTGTNKLPTSGSQAVHIDASAGSDDPVMIAANIIAFTGVNQTSPITVGAGNRLSNPGSTCVTTSAVPLPLPGSAIYVLAAAQYSGTATNPAQGGITTVMNLDNIGHQVHVYAGYNGSYPTVLTNASYTIGYTYQWCSPSGDLPIAIAPVRLP